MAVAATLDVLERAGWLSYTVGGGSPSLVAWSRGGAPRPHAMVGPDDEQVYRLSRFCSIHVVDGGWGVVSPVTGFELRTLDDRAWCLLGALAEPRRWNESAVLYDDLLQLRACWDLLLVTGVVEPVDADGNAPGSVTDRLRYWEPHDLFFHTASREGLSRGPFGGTYRFDGEPPDPPEIIQRLAEWALPVPGRAVYPEGHLFRLLDERRSVRRPAEALNLEQLSEFLYRCARTTGLARSEHGPVETRPYPSGGAVHELTLYLLVHRVIGLPGGAYRYRPHEHRLDQLPVETASARRLLADAAGATLRTEPPDVLVLLAADLPRLAWKYEGIAYALVLKHVGVVFQTMYLVAAAMSLAPCAVGGGDSAEFARALRLDPFIEPSVGEFVLGRVPVAGDRDAG